MYISGHVLSSTLVSEFSARKVGLRFRTFLTIVIACNLLDADHLWGYSADDGTASSFSLYVMHRFWWLAVAIPFIAGAFIRRLRPYFIAAGTGFLLHYSMDFLADLFVYNLVFLVLADTLCYGVIVWKAGGYGHGQKPLAAFATGALFIPWIVLAALRYGFVLNPEQTPVYHIVSLTMNAGFVFWAYFGLRKI